MADPPVFVDFATLAPNARPNNWLVAPESAVRIRANAPAPVFEVPAARLAVAWLAVVRAEPRTSVIAVSTDGLRVEASQRSRVFRFDDRISAQAFSMGAGRSTIAVYSRSLVGYWDWRVNRVRVERWLSALGARLAARSDGHDSAASPGNGPDGDGQASSDARPHSATPVATTTSGTRSSKKRRIMTFPLDIKTLCRF
jgi:uncharacterized protein (DUF1499 family)